MAVEPKRGCGYRKIGGLYMVGGQIMEPCDRLPFELTVCPCCGEGIKASRGYTWIDPLLLFEKDHDFSICLCRRPTALSLCPVCEPFTVFEDPKHISSCKAGLIWIGEQHYATPADFNREAQQMGVSRRINSIPNDFQIGKTWIFFAHRKAIDNGNGTPFDDPDQPPHKPGIFSAFRPSKIERIVKQSEYDLFSAVVRDFTKDGLDRDFWPGSFKNEYSEDQAEILTRLYRDIDRGITLVPVPDNDPDHQA